MDAVLPRTPAARAVPPPSAVGAAGARQEEPPASKLAETVTVTGASPAADTAAAVRIIEVVSPPGIERWRIVAGNRVEHSTDGGASWQPLAMPEPAGLAAGHSPAPAVAWLVGTGGTVYLTTNGRTFVRVPFIESIDLVAVTATSERAARITAADGRTFQTRDGGATWSRP
jgi:hypothetical protein